MEILKSIFCVLFEMSIVASIIGCVTLLVKNILKYKVSPKWLNVIWIVFLISLVNPIRIQSNFSIYNLFNYENIILKEEIPKMNEALDKHTMNGSNMNNNDKNDVNEENNIIKNSNITIGNLVSMALLLLSIIYFIEVIIKIIIKLVVYIKVYINSQNYFHIQRLNEILESVKLKIGLDKDVKLINQKVVRVPSVYGIFNTKILLTDEILELSDEEIELIFMHELLHIKNGDMLLNKFIQFLKVIYCFNPIIQYLLNNLKKEIELVNDEHVIDNLEKNKINLYCKTLLKISLLSNKEHCTTLSIVSRAGDLEDRIKMIKGKENFMKNKILIVSLVLIIVLGITVCFATNKITTVENDMNYFSNTNEKSNSPNMEGNEDIKNSNGYANNEIDSVSNITVKPLEGEIKVTSEYGVRIHPVTNIQTSHNGIDMKAEKGENVMAIANGTVEYAGYDFTNGNAVEIKHINQETNEVYYSFYAHLSEIDMNVGETVEAGKKIGEVGSTGMATGPHLHLEIRDIDKRAVNPREYVNF